MMTVSFQHRALAGAALAVVFVCAGTAHAQDAVQADGASIAATAAPAAKPYQSRINALLSRIASEKPLRLKAVVASGEPIEIAGASGRDVPIASVENGALNVFVEDCSGTDAFKSWQAAAFPLKVNESAEADTRDPFVNLRWVLMANAQASTNADGTTSCMSRASLPSGELYRVSLSGTVAQGLAWSGKKQFADEADYHAANRPNFEEMPVPSGAVICRDSSRLCFRNSRRAELVGELTANGVKMITDQGLLKDDFYVQTRRTKAEFAQRFGRLPVEVVSTPVPMIPAYLAQYDEYTNVISAKDNAAGRFAPSDLDAMREAGLDLSDLAVRGSHVSVIKAGGKAVLTRTDNTAAISIEPAEHGIPGLGTVASAGFSNGDISTIIVNGENVSPNMRGLNIVTLDDEANVIARAYFDTNVSAFRDYGYFRITP